MAALGSNNLTLVDLAKRTDPDGKIAVIVEGIDQAAGLLQHQVYKEGNLPTGERTTVRTSTPTVYARAINEGVQRSKSTTSQIDDGACMIAGFSEVDRQIAIMSGDVGAFRLSEAVAFYEAMAQAHARYTFYGNAAVSPKEFNGFTTRFNNIAGFMQTTGQQIIDAGGTGTDNFSVWCVGWHESTCMGIYPKGSSLGLTHEDTSAHTGISSDGKLLGEVITKADGGSMLAYRDYYSWHCGLSVKDHKYVARAANISRSLLRPDMSTGAVLEDILIRLVERIENVNKPGIKMVIYAPKIMYEMLRRQAVFNKRQFLDFDMLGGKRVMSFEGIPIVRIDALNVQEARVI